MSLRHGENWGELYDLIEDPHEIVNRFNDPGAAAAQTELTLTMVQRMIELQDRAPLPAYRA